MLYVLRDPGKIDKATYLANSEYSKAEKTKKFMDLLGLNKDYYKDSALKVTSQELVQHIAQFETIFVETLTASSLLQGITRLCMQCIKSISRDRKSVECQNSMLLKREYQN